MGFATPLHLAACLGRAGEDAALVLLDAGASPIATLNGGITAAHLAAWSGSDTLLSRLLTADTLLNGVPLADVQTAAGLTPLECAALGGQTECVRLLLQEGARGGSRLPALHCAAMSDEDAVMTALLDTW